MGAVLGIRREWIRGRVREQEDEQQAGDWGVKGRLVHVCGKRMWGVWGSRARSLGTPCSPLALPALGIARGEEERTNQLGACALGSSGSRGNPLAFSPTSPPSPAPWVNPVRGFSLSFPLVWGILSLLWIRSFAPSPSTLGTTRGPSSFSTGTRSLIVSGHTWMADLPIPGHFPSARFTRNDFCFTDSGSFTPLVEFHIAFRVEFIFWIECGISESELDKWAGNRQFACIFYRFTGKQTRAIIRSNLSTVGNTTYGG